MAQPRHPNVFRGRRATQPREREGTAIGGNELLGQIANQQQAAQTFAQPGFEQPGRPMATDVKPEPTLTEKEKKAEPVTMKPIAAPMKPIATPKTNVKPPLMKPDVKPPVSRTARRFTPSPARNRALGRKVGPGGQPPVKPPTSVKPPIKRATPKMRAIRRAGNVANA